MSEQYGQIKVDLNLPPRTVSSVMDVVNSVELSVSGPAISGAITSMISKQQLSTGSATATFSEVAPGTNLLSVIVRDAANTTIASASTPVSGAGPWLYGGETAMPVGPRLHALPFAALWCG